MFCFPGIQFPIGIDSERFIRALELPQVQEHIKELKERFAGRKVLSYGICFFSHENSLIRFYQV